MIKGSTQEEDITIVTIYVPNIGTPQYIRQTLIAITGDASSNIIILGDFVTPLISMDKSSTQKISKKTQVLNDILDQMELNWCMCVYKYVYVDTHTHRQRQSERVCTFHPKAAKFTFFSSAHGTFSRIDHMLGQKANSKFKKIISSIFSDHNTTR